MNKRIISLLLVLSLAVGLLVSAVPVFAITTQGLSATKTSAEAEETFSVSLKVPTVSEPISDASLKFTFDKDAFEVTAVDAPNVDGASKMFSSVADANANGFVSTTLSSNDYEASVNLPGYTLTATFKVKSAATAKAYDFTVTNFAINSLDDFGSSKKVMVISDLSESEKKIQVTVTAPTVKVTGVTLNKSSLTLTAGNNETLIATVAPDAATDKSVSWTSSNNDVATVSNGTVSALKKGTATITVKTTDGSKTATCTVTVNCAHANTTTHSAVSSTCKVQGHAAYTTCADCGEVISGSDDKLPLADHTYGTWIPEVPATHDANGVKGHYHCSVCEKDFDSGKNELSSLVITKDANHGTPATAWKNDATYHWHECKVVGCGVVIDSTKATHTFEWKTDTAATEDAAGVKHEECNVCGYKCNENTPIPKLDHTHTGITHHSAVPATCKATGNIEYWTCSSPKCSGKYYSDSACQNEITTGITTAKDTTNHVGGTEYKNSKPATCYEKGYEGDIYCLGCGNKIGNGKDIDKLNHTPGSWKTDATHHWKECTVVACGVVIDGSKAEHTFEWKVDTAATEDAAGVKHEECNICGYKRNGNTTIPKLDHTHTGITHHDAVPGSCKAEGNIEYWTCSSPKCAGKYYSEETCTVALESITVPVDENNHLHTEIRNKKDATCTEDGYTGDTYCTDCGKKLEDGQVIKATGHTYENGKCKVCGAKDPNYKAPEKDKEISPQTGDNSHMTLWIILASVSSLAVLALAFTKKKKTVR